MGGGRRVRLATCGEQKERREGRNEDVFSGLVHDAEGTWRVAQLVQNVGAS